MVKHSLWRMLEKYPYFLDKRRVSNLYKVTKVNNSVFRDLYNGLFHTYQGFHLNKRLLVWKTQTEPYNYVTHFCCGYPNIKKVEIYKNDILIHKEEFTEEEASEKTEKGETYCWDYKCNYVKTNMLPIKVYRCSSCDNIYFGDELPNNGICEECNSNSYYETKIFKCNNCNDYYFSDSVEDLTVNSTDAGYTLIEGYKCNECGELYEEIPNSCKLHCEDNEYEQVDVYKCNICGELYEVPPVNEPVIENNEFYTEQYVFKCMGNHLFHNGTLEDFEETDCGELYIGTEPPVICEICGGSAVAGEGDLFYNSDTVLISDNSTNYETNEIIEFDPDVEINPINENILISSNESTTPPNNITVPENHLFVRVTDTAGNYLKGVTVKLYHYQHYTELTTDEKGIVDFVMSREDNEGDYTHITFEKEGYVSRFGDEVYSHTLPPNIAYDAYYTDGEWKNNNRLLTVTLYSNKIYNALNTYTEEESFDLRLTTIEEVTDFEDNEEVLKVPLPVISDDKFLFHVETWDEYWVDKGFPENDTYLGDYYDHDYSLDEIGDLNNIPRKKYVDVNDNNLYPLTEPPFNKNLSEDDYHYMKRMIEYNLRMWASLIIFQKDSLDEDYLNYLNILKNIGISEEEYLIYKNNSRLFKEQYNPVSLELWKNYSIPSKLVNREKHILKLFDLRKHNSKTYKPYEVDDEGNPIKKYHPWELNSEGNPLNSSVGRLIYKDKWDVVTDLSECWIPENWEHKDKFCDGSSLYDTYFFVEPDTERPLPYENVYCNFKLRNSLAEIVDDDFHVYLEYYRDSEANIKPVNNRIITEGHCYLKYTLFNPTKRTTIRFNAYHTDYTSDDPYRRDEDNFIGSVDVQFNVRNACNADIYVDANSTQDIEDGSLTYPYKTLQPALNKVNKNLDLICVKSNLTIDEPLFVSSSCKIIGTRQRSRTTDCSLERGVSKVPVITNTNGKEFFNLIGNKNCNLKLVDLRLTHGLLSSYIGIGTWENNNRRLDDYESVIIHGGLAVVTVETDKNEYYPTDIVRLSISITDKNGVSIGNQKVRLAFNNNTPIILEDNDGDGIITYELHINESEIGIYDLVASLQSDIYFNSTVITRLNCTKSPQVYIVEDTVTITSTGHTPNSTFKVYIDGEFIEEVVSDEEGVITYEYSLEDWNSHIILFVDEEGNVVDMIVIQAKIDISLLEGKEFIKNFTVTDDGLVEYDTVTITSNSTLGDLDEVVIDLDINNEYVESETYSVKDSRATATNILYDECLILKEAIIDMNIDDNANVRFERIGEFWED